jgi:hypothetical protein
MVNLTHWQPVRRADIEMEVLPDGSALLYDPIADQGHAVAALAALVWDMCDGTMTVEALVADLTAQLPEVPQLAEIVEALLDEFRQTNLLESGRVQ